MHIRPTGTLKNMYVFLSKSLNPLVSYGNLLPSSVALVFLKKIHWTCPGKSLVICGYAFITSLLLVSAIIMNFRSGNVWKTLSSRNLRMLSVADTSLKLSGRVSKEPPG